MITAVTTCMGRLDHLKMSLPFMLQEFDKVIVVDWSCPEASGLWAAREGAEVFFKPGKKYWNAARARNFGARQVKTRSVCFIDCDTLPMPGLKEEIESLLNLSTMVVASRTSEGADVTSLNGFIALDIGQFWGVKGYDESLEGYALEDAHLRAHLRLERELKTARTTRIGSIRHTNQMRGHHLEEPIHVSAKRNYELLMSYLNSHGIQDWHNDPRTADIAYRSAS